MVSVIQDYFKGQTLEPIGFPQWVNVLEQSGNDRTADAVTNPALKLLTFFLEMKTVSKGPELDTTQTSKRSKTMQELRHASREWMSMWMGQWNF
jgi:hypothetical protein